MTVAQVFQSIRLKRRQGVYSPKFGIFWKAEEGKREFKAWKAKQNTEKKGERTKV